MTEEQKDSLDNTLKAGEDYLLHFVAELALAYNMHYVANRATSATGKATTAARKAMILAIADMVDKL